MPNNATAQQRGESLTPGFFSLKSLILAAAMLALFTILTRYPLGGANTYATSYASRIEFYSDRIDSLAHISSWRQRQFLRHVGNYEIPLWISEHRRQSDVIQLPPRAYAARYLQVEPTWTDPRIFTYFAGFQPIVAWSDTARRATANTWITLEAGSIALVRRDGTVNIDSLLSVYRQAELAGGFP